MKRIFCVILAVALALSLTACEGKPEPEPITAEIGGIIDFGGIDWLVLDVQDNEALIISRDIFENIAYHDVGGEITWESCSLRQYLNAEFYDSFSEAEKALIIKTELINDDNVKYDTVGGGDTADKIFLLSADEANRYFSDDAARIALTADGEAIWWRLRSPGYNSRHAVCVNDKGVINFYGLNVSLKRGFRPAMRIRLAEPSEIIPTAPEETTTTPATTTTTPPSAMTPEPTTTITTTAATTVTTTTITTTTPKPTTTTTVTTTTKVPKTTTAPKTTTSVTTKPPEVRMGVEEACSLLEKRVINYIEVTFPQYTIVSVEIKSGGEVPHLESTWTGTEVWIKVQIEPEQDEDTFWQILEILWNEFSFKQENGLFVNSFEINGYGQGGIAF